MKNLLICTGQNCQEVATWQMEHLPFCNTHKQQMPFVAFKKLEQKTIYQCNTNQYHGIANKYCHKCKLVQCSNCAFDHAIHGAVDIDKAHELLEQNITARLKCFEQERVEFDAAKKLLKGQQMVFLCNFNFSRASRDWKREDLCTFKSCELK